MKRFLALLKMTNFWVNLSANIEKVSGGGTMFTSHIDLRFGTP